MEQYKDFVIDFETLGTKPDCIVLSCALTFFNVKDDPETFGDLVERTYYWHFDWKQQETKRSIEPGTVEFWDKQDDAVKEKAFKIDEWSVSLETFVEQLDHVFKENGINRKYVLGWCRGQSFDFPILVNILEQCKKPQNFLCQFWNQRDIRTMISGLLLDPRKTKCPLPSESLPGFELHNPIHDNARAVMHLQYAMQYSSGGDVPDNIDSNS